MFIGTSYIPIHTVSGGCCSGVEIVSPALVIIGILLIVFGAGVGIVCLIYNFMEYPELRKEGRFWIYGVCALVVACGILMVVYGNQEKTVDKTELNVYNIYIEDKDQLEGLCESFDIIDIDGDIVTVREKGE